MKKERKCAHIHQSGMSSSNTRKPQNSICMSKLMIARMAPICAFGETDVRKKMNVIDAVATEMIVSTKNPNLAPLSIRLSPMLKYVTELKKTHPSSRGGTWISLPAPQRPCT